MLNGQAYELGLTAAPWCVCGQAWESVSHFLLECPRFAVHRARLRAVTGFNLSLEGLLQVRPHAQSGSLKILRAVARFCRDTERFC